VVEFDGLVKPFDHVGNWGMKKPELTDAGWLGPRDEMDRASHRFGKCSECHDTICVEKAVTDGPSTQRETDEMLENAFRSHIALKHPQDPSQAAATKV
jgi:hypothetical protein